MPADIRPAAVAGLFYPAETEVLRQQLSALLSKAPSADGESPPQAIIVPHAGYPFSGQTAALAWQRAASRAHQVRRVLLLGPSHRVALQGLATSPANKWRTPLGEIELDAVQAGELERLPFVESVELAHAQEHCLEVQVPFVQALFPAARLLPLLVGRAEPPQVAQVLARYWSDPSTLIAISSDLSHFHDYATAQRIDEDTRRAIEGLDYSVIGPEQACGCRAINGLLCQAVKTNQQVLTLGMCNSGDSTGERQRVVGYGAFLVQ